MSVQQFGGLRNTGLVSGNNVEVAPPAGWVEQHQVKPAPAPEVSSVVPEEEVTADAPATATVNLDTQSAEQVIVTPDMTIKALQDRVEELTPKPEEVTEAPNPEVAREAIIQILNEAKAPDAPKDDQDKVSTPEIESSVAPETEEVTQEASAAPLSTADLTSEGRAELNNVLDEVKDQYACDTDPLNAEARKEVAEKVLQIIHSAQSEEEPAPKSAPAKPRVKPTSKISSASATLDSVFVSTSNSKRHHSTRADEGIADRAKPITVVSISNRTLATVLNRFFGKKQVDDHIEYQGITRYGNRGYAIFDEGGATINDEGSVAIVTDPDGHAIAPDSVIKHDTHLNGRHAVVPCWSGCWVILGGYRQDENVVCIYKVLDSRVRPAQKDPVFVLRLCAYAINGEDFESVEESPEHPFSALHPAIRAANQQMFCTNSVAPGYVADYEEYTLFDTAKTDLNAALTDQEFVQRLKNFSSVTEAYAEADKLLGDAVTNLTRSQVPLLTVYLVQYSDCIVAWIIGTVYDKETKSSTQTGGRLLYGKVLLDQNSKFYYPDRDASEFVPLERLSEVLKQHRGNLPLVFKRLTPHKD